MALSFDNTSVWALQSSDDIPTFATPPGRPTEVSIGVYLIGLSQVSEPSDAFPTYDVEMFFNVTWKDPRLAFGGDDSLPHVFQEEEAEEKLSEIWSPDFEIQNEVQQRQTESIELTIFPDGSVDYEERFGATLNAELDLRRFPFDRQKLDIELQSFTWDHAELTIVATHTVVSRNLPRLSYPTSADALLIVCYMVATSLTVVSIVVQRLEERGEIERARRIDRHARWIVPAVAVCILSASVLILWS
jgi:hypothetical protein